jgi:hypothetical protein
MVTKELPMGGRRGVRDAYTQVEAAHKASIESLPVKPLLEQYTDD